MSPPTDKRRRPFLLFGGVSSALLSLFISTSSWNISLAQQSARHYSCPFQDVVASPQFQIEQLQGVWFEIGNTFIDRSQQEAADQCTCGSYRFTLPDDLRDDVDGDDTPPGGQCAPLEQDTDYPGNDLGETQRNNSTQCCQDCRDLDGCQGFVWTDWNAGTCWLKSSLPQERQTSQRGVMAGRIPEAQNGNNSQEEGEETRSSVRVDYVCTAESTMVIRTGNASLPLTRNNGIFAVVWQQYQNENETAGNDPSASDGSERQEWQRMYPGGGNMLVLALKQGGSEDGGDNESGSGGYLVLGSPCYLGARILSRSPDLSSDEMNEAVSVLRDRNYPLDILDFKRVTSMEANCDSVQQAWDNLLPTREGGGQPQSQVREEGETNDEGNRALRRMSLLVGL